MPQASPYHVAGRERILETGEARVTLLTLDPGQAIPPHRHTTVTDTTFCLSGTASLRLRDPAETIALSPGARATVPPGRVHDLTNTGTTQARLLLIQGPGAYDFLPVA